MPSTPRRIATRLTAAALAALAGLAVAGCSGSGGGSAQRAAPPAGRPGGATLHDGSTPPTT
ncbi:MAG: hypothetical protein ACJ74O_12370, partial [Frankiaceae bacterium]